MTRTCRLSQQYWLLTHAGLNKMVNISQTTFSNALSWKKIFVLWLQFHWSLFLKVYLTLWFRYWFGAEQLPSHYFNTLRPRQNGRLFADDTFKRIFLNETVIISIKISLKFVPKGLFNNIPALVLIMAWRRPGDKPLSEPMMVRTLTHICVTRPQWVNQWWSCGRYSIIPTSSTQPNRGTHV